MLLSVCVFLAGCDHFDDGAEYRVSKLSPLWPLQGQDVVFCVHAV